MTWWLKYFYPSAFALILVGEGLWFGLFGKPPLLPFLSTVYGVWKPLLLFCVVVGIAIFLVVLQGLPLKRVRMDDESLYISNYLREIRMPLSGMAHVSELLGWRQGNRVTITFRNDTPFGRTITFMPPISWAHSSWTGRGTFDPIVGELRAHIRD